MIFPPDYLHFCQSRRDFSSVGLGHTVTEMRSHLSSQKIIEAIMELFVRSGLRLDVGNVMMLVRDCWRYDRETVRCGRDWGHFCVFLYSQVSQIMSACCFTVELHVLTDYFCIGRVRLGLTHSNQDAGRVLWPVSHFEHVRMLRWNVCECRWPHWDVNEWSDEIAWIAHERALVSRREGDDAWQFVARDNVRNCNPATQTTVNPPSWPARNLSVTIDRCGIRVLLQATFVFQSLLPVSK